MIELPNYLPDLITAYSAYLIATLSPGPANLAIMGNSMSRGRKPGLALALGVVSGSFCWAVLAALGLSALLATFGWAFTVIKVAGGCYLFWLAWKSLRSALSNHDVRAIRSADGTDPLSSFFTRGFAIHMTNPKAVFAWVAIIALGLRPNAPAWVAVAIVGGCFVLGLVVFGGYALVFSTDRMIRLYASFRRPIEAATAMFFGFSPASS